MLLPQQIQAILYHFLMGWFYGCTFSFLCVLTSYMRFTLFKTSIDLLFHMMFTLLMYYGLYKINGGVTDLYLAIIFVGGVLIYYKIYFHVFHDAYLSIVHCFRPVRKKLKLVKSKILGIIKAMRKIYSRRFRNGSHKDKKRKKEESSNAPVL